MKTTSYKISKQLKEAGFEAETDFHFYGQQLRNSAFPSHSTDTDKKVYVKSYDLETILNALPIYIRKEYKDKLSGKFINYVAELTISKYLHSSYVIEYRCYDIVPNLENTDIYFDRIFSCFTETEDASLADFTGNKLLFTENVSLADAAGSMWLKIKENKCLCIYHG